MTKNGDLLGKAKWNREPMRDWGHTSDYIKAMWLMLQQDEPGDYVIATGEPHSVKEFLESAFSYVDLDYRDYLAIDEKLCRPSEVNILQGDSSKVDEKLEWAPTISFEELVREMVESELELYSSHKTRPFEFAGWMKERNRG